MALPPRHRTVTVLQASAQSSTLSALRARIATSTQHLQAVRGLIPATLRDHVRAGPVDDTSWCLLVPSQAAAAKLRQLLPDLLAALQQRGWPVQSIRLSVQREPLR
jgi:hypothetical protein